MLSCVFHLPFTAHRLYIAAAGNGGFAGVFRFSSIVGYQNKGFENSGYNIAAVPFTPVQGEESAMTLGDLVPNDEFVYSSITFMTPGGATAKTTFGGKQVAQKYVYWAADDDPEEGAGWYLYADEDGETNQNATLLPFGDGFLVQRSATETDANLVYSGAVKTTPTTKGFANSGYNICGNCSPTAITLGDITPNDEFVYSSITFMTPGGATAKTTFGGKQVAQKYVYWAADDDPEEGAGWYLYADEDGETNQNALILEAGEGFLVQRSATETEAKLTIPSAL